MAKGGGWERSVSRTLSLWWSGGEHDDLLWRTSQSGGRATTRFKQGKRTINQYGDLYATSPDAEPLTRVLTIECKKGYSKHSIQDVLDRPTKGILRGVKQELEKWIEQAVTAHKAAGSVGWMIISRRTGREPLVLMPSDLWNLLEGQGPELGPVCPCVFLTMGAPSYEELVVMRLVLWMEAILPEYVRRVYEESCK